MCFLSFLKVLSHSYLQLMVVVPLIAVEAAAADADFVLAMNLLHMSMESAEIELR